MIAFSILQSLFKNVIATGYVEKIYHSVIMNPTKEGGKKPSAFIDSRVTYLGPDDTKGFSCYCRETGPTEIRSEERLSSCNLKLFKLQTPFRMVFQNQIEERNHEEIISALIGAFSKTSKVKFVRLNSIALDLLAQETPTGSFTITENTFYQAIDFLLLLEIQGTTCETDTSCNNLENPYGVS